jgi:hypothetical protein
VVAAESKPAATLALLQDWWAAYQDRERDPIQVGGPVPAVGGLQHDLGVGAGLGQLQRQRNWVVVDPDGLQHLAVGRHAHDHRAAAVQVDPDVLFTHGGLPCRGWCERP